MTDPAESLPTTPSTPELDRGALNALTTKALDPQVYFGNGLELTKYDREQFGLIATGVEAVLEPSLADPEWTTFEALVKEGSDKGVLQAFATHQGTKVPIWCINGGEDAIVKKIRTDEGRPAIEVPTKIFNLYHWTQTLTSLKTYITTSNETLKGRSTKFLGIDLEQLAHLLPKSDNELS